LSRAILFRPYRNQWFDGETAFYQNAKRKC
jgi:hypothetical protein